MKSGMSLEGVPSLDENHHVVANLAERVLGSELLAARGVPGLVPTVKGLIEEFHTNQQTDDRRTLETCWVRFQIITTK